MTVTLHIIFVVWAIKNIVITKMREMNLDHWICGNRMKQKQKQKRKEQEVQIEISKKSRKHSLSNVEHVADEIHTHTTENDVEVEILL